MVFRDPYPQIQSYWNGGYGNPDFARPLPIFYAGYPQGAFLGVEPLLENPLHPIYLRPPLIYPESGNPWFPQTPISPPTGNPLKGENGTMNLEKMLNTAGQLLGVASQAANLIKGFGQLFKT
jgi:hypothetical protein